MIYDRVPFFLSLPLIGFVRWLGYVMRMPGERVARQVLIAQIRDTLPVGSPTSELRQPHAQRCAAT
jgi:hypothetical protein